MHTSFNTSHITLYQTSGTGTDRRKQVSIHLMLLFIGKGCSNFSCLYTFQYISCYSLSINAKFISSHKPVSIHLMLLFIGCPNRTHSGHYGLFNTSHVTLYRKRAVSISAVLWFQYISCYSLSEDRDRNCKKVQAFQYISCYSLSHFLIFLADRSFVSIHLMLLFISIVSAIPSAASLFQYISCYSLSLKASVMTGRNARFNTSHVTLYLNGFTTTLFSQCVSIHLMLLFILPG